MHNHYSIAQTMRKQASLNFEYEAWTFLGLGVCPSVSDTDTTLTHMIPLNYVIFSNYYWCQRVMSV